LQLLARFHEARQARNFGQERIGMKVVERVECQIQRHFRKCRPQVGQRKTGVQLRDYTFAIVSVNPHKFASVQGFKQTPIRAATEVAQQHNEKFRLRVFRLGDGLFPRWRAEFEAGGRKFGGHKLVLEFDAIRAPCGREGN
jgi:hypothetical protein